MECRDIGNREEARGVEDRQTGAAIGRQRPKAVYSIIEWESEGADKSYWLRLGTAYVNRDQSLTVVLNALPVNRRLHIRDLPPRE